MANFSHKVHAWTQRRFLMDSGFYAGRPPTTSDLNSPILESIYDGIKKDIGDKAATNFVRFVNKLDNLAASSFVVALERFFASDCKTVEVEQRKEDQSRITAHGDAAMAQGFALIASAFCGEQKSDVEVRRLSDGLKYRFIRNHLAEIPQKEQRDIQPSAYAI